MRGLRRLGPSPVHNAASIPVKRIEELDEGLCRECLREFVQLASHLSHCHVHMGGSKGGFGPTEREPRMCPLETKLGAWTSCWGLGLVIWCLD